MNIPESAVITQSLGLLIIRLGIGVIFIKHGCDKALGGVPVLTWVGQQMIFIHAYPLFWGIMATLAEFFGGLFFMLGWYTRVVAALLAFVMIVAIVYHVSHNDDFTKVSHPLSFLFICIAFIITGAGIYSFDGDQNGYISSHIAAWWTYLLHR